MPNWKQGISWKAIIVVQLRININIIEEVINKKQLAGITGGVGKEGRRRCFCFFFLNV